MKLHTPQSLSRQLPKGEQQENSPTKLEGVPQRGGGVCDNQLEGHTPQSLCDSSPNLGEQQKTPFIGVGCRPRVVCNYRTSKMCY